MIDSGDDLVRAAGSQGVCADAHIDGVGNLGDLITRAAERWADRTAWRFGATGETLSFTEVEAVTRYLAGELSAVGIGAGDRVVLMAKNTLEFPAAWLALARLGAIVVPMNTNYRLTDATHVASLAGATAFLTVEEFLSLAGQVAERCPLLEKVFSLEGLLLGWRSGDSPREPAAPLDQAKPGDTSNIQFTSGTTGKPKGCVLPHEYWLSIAWTLQHDFPHLTDADVMLTVQPFHYIDPQWNVASALLAGVELVILDRFHPSTFWQSVREFQVTYFYCLGLMPTLLLKMPPSDEDRNNRVRAVQASAIPASIHRALEERWGAPWYEAFGMTETGADLFVDVDEHDELLGSGCLGRPRSHREALVVDDSGAPCAVGQTGQLLLRGAGLMTGYFEDAEATERAFRGGWFHTGDLAERDELGRLYYRGRTKDMIRRSGENISAIEVEEVLVLHPGVELAAVVAVPDELRGEEVLAYLVPSAPAPSAVDLIDSVSASCATELAYFKVPRYWRVERELPRTVSERVAKHELTQAGSLRGAWDSKEGRWHE
ncbi:MULTISPECIES: AMP-binding protein [Cryobacterium]|uniref:AMP-binding protein n=1 Tax=Cryobacterium TaxID=69578 RepID=UPI001F53E448|nr:MULTISPECIES: AMP-binding protein [Cryobacterium]